MLYVQVRARMQTPDSTRPSVVKARDDLDLLRHCEATRRRAWEVALDYYEVHFASLDLVFDASLIATTGKSPLIPRWCRSWKRRRLSGGVVATARHRESGVG